MSTRGVYVFAERAQPGLHDRDAFCVYVHYDNYPEGAARYFRAFLAGMPAEMHARGDYDAQAVQFIATVRGMLRSVRGIALQHRWDEAGDIEYAYLVYPRGGDVHVEAFDTRSAPGDLWGPLQAERFFTGTIEAFIARYEEAVEPV